MSGALILAGLFFTCGCRSPVQSLFNAGGPDWRIQQGQALWRPKNGMPEIGGDLVMASDADGRRLIQFDKTPIELVIAQVESNRWLMKFSQQNMVFSGRGPGPTRFGWLYLPAALDGKPLPSDFHFEHKADGGWRLENKHTGEILDGFLTNP